MKRIRAMATTEDSKKDKPNRGKKKAKTTSHKTRDAKK